MNYEPIACRLYDELERIIIEKREVELVYETETGMLDAPQQRSARIVDIYTRDKQEFIRLEDGTEIRLDRLIRAAHHDFRGNDMRSC
ncbi:MAG: hypothetical protein LAT67_11435 [Balneolales bacterium]|nr:hypothetical protein [Balneolales bacterium]